MTFKFFDKLSAIFGGGSKKETAYQDKYGKKSTKIKTPKNGKISNATNANATKVITKPLPTASTGKTKQKRKPKNNGPFTTADANSIINEIKTLTFSTASMLNNSRQVVNTIRINSMRIDELYKNGHENNMWSFKQSMPLALAIDAVEDWLETDNGVGNICVMTNPEFVTALLLLGVEPSRIYYYIPNGEGVGCRDYNAKGIARNNKAMFKNSGINFLSIMPHDFNLLVKEKGVKEMSKHVDNTELAIQKRIQKYGDFFVADFGNCPYSDGNNKNYWPLFSNQAVNNLNPGGTAIQITPMVFNKNAKKQLSEVIDKIYFIDLTAANFFDVYAPIVKWKASTHKAKRLTIKTNDGEYNFDDIDEIKYVPYKMGETLRFTRRDGLKNRYHLSDTILILSNQKTRI